MAHFPLPFVTLVTKSTRDSRYDLYSKASQCSRTLQYPRRSIRCGTTKISPPSSRYRTILRFDKALHRNFPRCRSFSLSLLRPTIPSALLRRVCGETKEEQKVTRLKSELRTSSILKSETKSTRLPTYLEIVHLLSQLPSASTNRDSIFNLAKISSSLESRAPPFVGGLARAAGWKKQTAWMVAGARKIFAEWNAKLR